MTADPLQTKSIGLRAPPDKRRSLVVLGGGLTREVELPASGTVVLGRDDGVEVPVDDPTLSRRHLQIEIGATARVSDLDSHNGTRIRGQTLTPGVPVELVCSDLIEAGNTTIVFRDEAAASARRFAAGAWAQSRMLAERVQATEVNVLVVGPPGSGKRTLATRIVGATCRVVDGRTMDADAIAELASHSDPLCICHVDDIAPALHAKLATAIKAAPRRRVTSTASRDVSLLVAETRFFLGLHNALCGITIRIPPLSDCTDELPAIADELVRGIANRMRLGGAPRLASDARGLLRDRPWPGDLAELARCLETTMAGGAGPTIRAADIRFPQEAPVLGNPQDVERQRITDALAECGGNQTKAARLLKISRRTLVSRLDRYGITRPRKPKV